MSSTSLIGKATSTKCTNRCSGPNDRLATAHTASEHFVAHSLGQLRVLRSAFPTKQRQINLGFLFIKNISWTYLVPRIQFPSTPLPIPSLKLTSSTSLLHQSRKKLTAVISSSTKLLRRPNLLARHNSGGGDEIGRAFFASPLSSQICAFVSIPSLAFV